jgi:hypothetical protein
MVWQRSIEGTSNEGKEEVERKSIWFKSDKKRTSHLKLIINAPSRQLN